MLTVKAIALLLYLQVALALHSQYQFSTELDNEGLYQLLWSVNLEEKTIRFAVNVSTTGWVGLGLSRNGGMAGSDIVIGWVDDTGEVYFKDRHATGEFLPAVDASQDWFLVSGEEEDRHTILEFTRNFTTCDDNDMDIKLNTARIIWSYHSSDPSDEDMIFRHEVRGGASVNLLGRLPEVGDEDKDGEVLLTTDNITIPSTETTFWCVVHRLPEVVRQQERYVYKFTPVITEGNVALVYHMVVYLCDNLNNTLVGTSDVCTDTHLDIHTCRSRAFVIANWLFGGQDTIFPEGVALPIGGEEAPGHYLILEIHYDNPQLISGTVDSSGFRFLYRDTPPQHRAGVIVFGGAFSPHTVIPPDTDDFVVTALFSEECSTKHLPPEGINVFGSALHTHLAGHALLVQHYRETEECGGLEELKPIDEDRQYDFNYQQFKILPEEVNVLPGDQLQIECHYRTTHPRYSGVTLAGLGTRDELCLVFLYYYPQSNISLVLSAPENQAYADFADRYLNESVKADLDQGLRVFDFGAVRSIMDTVDWSQGGATQYLQALVKNSTQISICYTRNPTDTMFTTGILLPASDCPYEEPDVCDVTPTVPGSADKMLPSIILIHLVWVFASAVLLLA